MSRSQRTKGHGGEREVCHLLSELLGQVVRRHIGQARDGGCDIELGPFVIEVKRRARIAGVHDWMTQAIKAAEVREDFIKDGEMLPEYPNMPVIVFRGDGKEWIVGFRLPDAATLMREALS